MSGPGFVKLNEDPFYDEDGVLIDEDAEWENMPFPFSDMDPRFNPNDFEPEELSPHATINS
jgi:hypothetical protein